MTFPFRLPHNHYLLDPRLRRRISFIIHEDVVNAVLNYMSISGVRSCYDEGKRVAETLMFDYHRQHGIGNLWSSFPHNGLSFFFKVAGRSFSL